MKLLSDPMAVNSTGMSTNLEPKRHQLVAEYQQLCFWEKKR
jgi:hypothetical protein